MRKYLKEGRYSYSQDQILGTGTFGKVFKGYDHNTSKWLALKQLNLQKLQQYGEQLKTIVLSQISVMKKFSKKIKQKPCPYLVKHIDCFRTQKYIYIAMELCQGGTLHEEIQKKCLNQEQCKFIIYCIGKGLSYLAQLNIVHRDLKPDNIYIAIDQQTEQKVYKIGDFGFATYKQQLDLPMGTLPYMAPQMFVKGKYTNKVDIWSMGVISYQIYFNKLYFDGKDRWEIQKNIKQKPFTLSKQEKARASVSFQNFLFLCLVHDQMFRLSPQNIQNQPLILEVQKQLLQKANQIKKTQNFGNNTKQEINDPPNNQIKVDKYQKIRFIVKQCVQLRNMAEQFAYFSQKTSRFTQFIQVYLLKNAYVMMNKITYSLIYRQNYMDMTVYEFGELTEDAQTDQQYKLLTEKCQQQCGYITSIFNQKYKRFHSQYLLKFSASDRQLINKTVNQQPYQFVNQDVFQKQLAKWIVALKKYENQSYITLSEKCERVLKIKK